MNELWKIELPVRNAGLYEYNGVFTAVNNEIYFYHLCGKDIALLRFAENGEKVDLHLISSKNRAIDIPYRWQLKDFNGRKYLIVGNDTAMDVISQEFLETASLDPDLPQRYEEKKNSKFLEEGRYIFDDYYIEHYKSFGFRCFDSQSGAMKWQITLKGYLYSEIFKYKKLLIFCTAGHGGGVYGVDQDSGKISFFINTGGTAKYVLRDNIMFFCKIGKKDCCLMKIDLDNREVIDQISIEGSVVIDFPIFYFNSKIYLLSAKRIKNDIKPIITCFQI